MELSVEKYQGYRVFRNHRNPRKNKMVAPRIQIQITKTTIIITTAIIKQQRKLLEKNY